MVTQSRVNGDVRMAESTAREAYGASQIVPFDYCPKLGFREYWYPAVEARRVRGKPVHLQMLGDDLVLFRDTTGRVAALSDWCPHRGARLSLGVCEFKGTVTCPYHGYTFDGTGQCVAALIERPDSPFIGKLRARSYPTEEQMGIVFVWMGETEPVPIVQDLPAELSDPELTGRRFMRVKVWEANWTEPMAQGIDFHEFYLHRGVNIWRLFNYRLGFKRERLNLERPQKLGPLDVGLIYFRRHLAQRARDYQRLGRAEGALKSEGAPAAPAETSPRAGLRRQSRRSNESY
jgi:nitrite reductase/ring-hydroxylating ferredoxin subunit